MPEPASPDVPITAIVTAFRNTRQVMTTLQVLERCCPRPAEVLVHVDGNQQAVASEIRRAHPAVVMLVSERNVGPGGGRNLMLHRASHEIVASFDDDSRPLDADYFARVATVFERYPEAAIVTAAITHKGETAEPAAGRARWIADFSGGACVYRRAAALDVGAYLSLPTAYGMEEVDFALRLHARGARILYAEVLRVYHDTDLSHHADASVTSASLANIALLAYLRYPLQLWPIAAGQLLNRLQWLLRHGRRKGVVSGLLRSPSHVWRHRRARGVLPAAAVLGYLRLRRHPEEASGP